jgi:hypothetical protein
MAKTTRRFKKGDVVRIARVWSTPGERNGWRSAVSVRTLRVESWGKEQATFTDVVTGEFIRERGYTDSFACATTDEGVAALADEVKEQVRRGLARELQLREDWIEKYRHTARPDAVEHMREQLEPCRLALTAEIEVADYHHLKERSRARLDAERGN